MDGISKFEELLRTDKDFQEKLRDAVLAYTGEQTEEAIFDQVLVPLAAEYGITGTFEEFRNYISSLSERELSTDEMAQISGGTNKGGGIDVGMCFGMGFGVGVGGGQGAGNVCALIGVGYGSVNCTGTGEVLDENPWEKHL